MTPSTIRELRRRLGLSQAAFASALGLDGQHRRQEVRRMEAGEREPTGPQKRILALLDAAEREGWDWQSAIGQP